MVNRSQDYRSYILHLDWISRFLRCFLASLQVISKLSIKIASFLAKITNHLFSLLNTLIHSKSPSKMLFYLLNSQLSQIKNGKDPLLLFCGFHSNFQHHYSYFYLFLHLLLLYHLLLPFPYCVYYLSLFGYNITHLVMLEHTLA